MTPQPGKRYRFDRFVIDPANGSLHALARPIPLRPRSFDVLCYLVERAGRLVTKQELFGALWPNVIVTDDALVHCVAEIRQALGDSDQRLIRTMARRGYIFTPAVQELHGAESMDSATSAPAPMASAPGNLAPRLAPLFGRDDDLRALLAQIEAHPLVTIVAAAGMGKTALARAAAHALRERWSDGAWLVELAPLADPGQLPQTVAQGLRISLSASQSAQDQLVSVLGSQTLLLVLDNCEHLVDSVGSLAGAIVARAPGVRLLATSQELLNISDETLFKLNPLALPATAEGLENAEQFGAIRLFTERAQAADPRFSLSSSNAEAVADICRRLDGLPLAIELAAARVRLLGVQGLRDKLGERFRVLAGGARSAMRRHQSLRAAIDWSHALLTTPEQVVLRRVGVFVGGFTLALAQRVAQDEQLDDWAVLDALSALVDKSLIAADAADTAELPRYLLLETTRAYALEKLAESAETSAWIERHARAVCEFFERTEEARYGEQGTLSMAAYMQQLVPELDNARAALDWATRDARDPAVAVGLAGASAEVFRQLGLAQEALRWMLAAQAHVDDTEHPQRAALFWERLSTLGNVGRLPKAVVLEAADRAQRIYRASGARRRLHQALTQSAWSLNQTGESGAAAAMLPEISSLEDPTWPPWLRCMRLSLQGFVYQNQECFEDSLAAFVEQQALLSREPGEEPALLRCQANQCLAFTLLQRYEDAVDLARSVIARERGGHSGGMVYLMHNFVLALIFLGRIDEAWQATRLAMPAWRRDGLLSYASGTLATLSAERGLWADAARLGGAATAYQRRNDIEHYPGLQRTSAHLQALLEAAPCRPEDIERWQREGLALDEAAIAAISLRDEEPAPIGLGA